MESHAVSFPVCLPNSNEKNLCYLFSKTMNCEFMKYEHLAVHTAAIVDTFSDVHHFIDPFLPSCC